MQEFFKSTIESKFIKALLYNIPVPIIPTVGTGDFVLNGYSYIYNGYVMKCIRTGFLGSSAKYRNLYPFIFGTHYILFSERFMSSSDAYDTQTHEKLGDYLRCYRDITGIDLMPFYNCFSGNYLPNAKINTNGVFLKKVDEYKTIKIPIKFNKTYTVALDCNSQVKMACAFLDQNQLLDVTLNGTDINELIWSKEGAIQIYSTMSFNRPQTYKINNTTVYYGENECRFFHKYEKDLYLLIQLPIKNDSSVTILEGDYLDTISKFSDDEVKDSFSTCKHIYNMENLYDFTASDINKACLSSLSLLMFTDKKQHPFADRLIEYLLLNVIDSEDEIPKNVERVQQNMKLSIDGFSQKVCDIWLDELRPLIYNKIKKSSIPKLDLNGFVDKDIEMAFEKGKL